MRIAVTRCDGDTEIINLHGTVIISDGPGQARIHCADGTDHFFCLSDGKYDGYGLGAPDEGWTQAQAETMLRSFDSGRQIIHLSVTRILIDRFVRFFRQHPIRIAYLNRQARRKTIGNLDADIKRGQ